MPKEKSKYVVPAPSPAHRAAIDRLPTEPGECAVCGEALVYVIVEDWRGDGFPHPPPRFACEAHDVWIGFCVDDDVSDGAYEGGLYSAVLRDASDPYWDWLPAHMRAAGAKCGFGARYPDDWVGWRLVTLGDRAWATDGRMMIDIGTAAEGEAALDRTGNIRARLQRESETKMFRVPADAVWPTFAAMAGARAADVGKPYAALDGAVMIGDVAVQKDYIDFAAASWPGITWYVTREPEPVFGKVGDSVRAVVMPLRTK